MISGEVMEMRIQELEQRSGLERASIRFYEKEGLLTPERKDNGYRDYTQADLEELLRIRLLRELDVPIGTIRELQQGSATLSDVLAGSLAAMEIRREKTERGERLCRELQKAGAAYSTLDGRLYLDRLNEPQTMTQSTDNAAHIPTCEDVLEPEIHPFRRLFARMLDRAFLNILILLLVYSVFRVRPVTRFGVDFIGYGAAWLLIVLEALMISFFGTTPGKWLMGIRIDHYSGDKMPFRAALARSFGVFVQGQGLGIPVYELICMWKSYKKCKEGAEQEWDEECEITYEPWDAIRKAAAAAAVLGLLLGAVWVVSDSVRPKNRGNYLSVREFAENYNDFSAALSEGGHMSVLPMGEDGRFLSDSVMYYIEDRVKHEVETPQFDYTLSDDKITAISYSCEINEMEYRYWTFPNTAKIAVLLAEAQQKSSSNSTLTKLEEQLDEAWTAHNDTYNLISDRVSVSWNVKPIDASKESVRHYYLHSSDGSITEWSESVQKIYAFSVRIEILPE